jgi:hypothetical protein
MTTTMILKFEPRTTNHTINVRIQEWCSFDDSRNTRSKNVCQPSRVSRKMAQPHGALIRIQEPRRLCRGKLPWESRVLGTHRHKMAQPHDALDTDSGTSSALPWEPTVGISCSRNASTRALKRLVRGDSFSNLFLPPLTSQPGHSVPCQGAKSLYDCKPLFVLSDTLSIAKMYNSHRRSISGADVAD